MEEQVPPATGDDPPPANNNLAIQLASASAHGRLPPEVYVVQVPKDQIYRVPPPENARFIEEQRSRVTSSGAPKQKRPWLKILIGIVVVLILIGVIIGVSIFVVYKTTHPVAPSVSISGLTTKKSTDGSPPNYNVKLKVKNKNDKLGVEYGSSDDGASLIFLKQGLATGTFPTLTQKSGKSDDVQLKLSGVQDLKLPKNVKESMDDKTPTHQISLALKFNSPLVMNNGLLKMWKKTLDVSCTFRVSTMGPGSKVMAQECDTKLS